VGPEGPEGRRDETARDRSGPDRRAPAPLPGGRCAINGPKCRRPIGHDNYYRLITRCATRGPTRVPAQPSADNKVPDY
jgi:hypothetical protein